MKLQSFNLPRIASAISIAALVFGVLGCTATRNVKIKPSTVTKASATDKLPLAAILVLDREFNKHISTNKVSGGGTLIYPLGAALSRYAKDVAENVFKHVVVCDSIETGIDKGDIILIPKVVRSNVVGLNYKTLIQVEWLAKDRFGRQPVWLGTIEANTVAHGFAAKSRERASVQAAFDELAKKTTEAFLNSPELKDVAPHTQ